MADIPLYDWIESWAVDMHPDIHLRGLELTDGMAASFPKERMNKLLFEEREK